MSVDGSASRFARGCAAALLSLCAWWARPSIAFGQAQKDTPAAPPVVTLEWVGPGPELSCLGEEGLAREVEEYLGRDAFATGPAELAVRVNVERQPDCHWRAVIEVRDASGAVLGSRSLVSSDELCSSLNEPLTLAVALMVGSEPEPSEPEPKHQPEPEPEPERDPDVVAPRPRPVGEQHTLGLSVEAAAILQGGLLPAPSFGLEIGLGFEFTSFLVARASGVGFLPARAELAGSASASLGLLYADLTLCPRLTLTSRWQLEACGGVALGALSAESHGLEGARSTTRRFLGATLDLRANFRLGRRWAVFGSLGGVIPVHPDHFVYALNGTPVDFFHPAAFAPVGGIGGWMLF